MSGLDLLISQNALWYMLLVAVLTGVGLGVFCDGLFILRLLSGDSTATDNLAVQSTKKEPVSQHLTIHRRRLYAVLRGLCDVILMLTIAVTLLLFCYYTSDGQLRAPAVFGISVGFWFYHQTVSRLLRRCMATVLGVLGRILKVAWAQTVGRVLGITVHLLTRRWRNTATNRRIRKLTDQASRGFGLSDRQSHP